MATVETSKMLAAAAEACDEKQAEDIRILALDPTESGLTDYFLICTGSNNRQTVAITDEIELRLKREYGTYPNSVEGRRQGEWILMDYVDFIVHVFLPEKRAYYGLERLRPSATTLSIAGLNAEIKAAITAGRAGRVASKFTQSTPETDSAADPSSTSPSARKSGVKKLAAKRGSTKIAGKAPAKRAGSATGKATAKTAATAAKRAVKLRSES